MSQRLFTPTFIGLAVANFCNAMIFYLLVPTMAGYAADEFGASPAVGGALASIFFVGGLSARLLSGWLVDRLGSRSLARVAAVGYLITTAAYLVAPGLAAMFVVRLLNGVGFGLLGSALTTGVMMTIPPQRRSEGSGWFGVGLSISIGVGPFLALTLARGPGGMRAVFLTALGSAALAVVLPLLTIVANFAALAGAAVVAWAYSGITFEVFLTRLHEAVAFSTLISGMVKAPFMALVVGIVAAVEGLKVGGSAESLGKQVTASVVKSIFVVILMDGLFAMFYAAIGF